MVAPDSALPPPTSGSFLEISFRRLLASCEDIVAGDDKGRPDLSQWQRSPVFHHYVETLQEQLADLAVAGKARIDAGLLQQYRKHVDAIANQLQKPELPAYCLPPPAAGALGSAAPLAVKPAAPKPRQAAAGAALPPAAAAAEASAGTATPPSTSQPTSPAKQQQQQQQQQQQRQHTAAEQRAEVLGGAGGPGGGAASGLGGTAAAARLRTHAAIQEGLTDELAGLAASLKTNTLAMEGKLRERGALLEGAENALDTSVARTKASATAAAAIHRRGRLNLCFTCLVMMVVGAVFCAMYLFIRFTRLAGYKAVPRAAPAGAVPVPVPGAAMAGGGGELPPPLGAGAGAEDLQLLNYERHYEAGL